MYNNIKKYLLIIAIVCYHLREYVESLTREKRR